MNMVLNNLEQKLNKDNRLCSAVADLIDLIIETDVLLENLNMVDTHILIVKARIRNLIKELEVDKEIQIEETINHIKEKLLVDNQVYLQKIRNTIEYCIENYKLYQQSNYYMQYSKQLESEKVPLLDLFLL